MSEGFPHLFLVSKNPLCFQQLLEADLAAIVNNPALALGFGLDRESQVQGVQKSRKALQLRIPPD